MLAVRYDQYSGPLGVKWLITNLMRWLLFINNQRIKLVINIWLRQAMYV